MWNLTEVTVTDTHNPYEKDLTLRVQNRVAIEIADQYKRILDAHDPVYVGMDQKQLVLAIVKGTFQRMDQQERKEFLEILQKTLEENPTIHVADLDLKKAKVDVTASPEQLERGEIQANITIPLKDKP